MVKEKFNTLSELYRHVMPALRSKAKELKLGNLSFIKEKDIWDCLKNTKWYSENDLTLYDIVSDILYLEEKTLVNYINTRNKNTTEKKKKTENKSTEEDNIL